MKFLYGREEEEEIFRRIFIRVEYVIRDNEEYRGGNIHYMENIL